MRTFNYNFLLFLYKNKFYKKLSQKEKEKVKIFIQSIIDWIDNFDDFKLFKKIIKKHLKYICQKQIYKI